MPPKQRHFVHLQLRQWATRCKVPMSDATVRRLTELAEEMSTAQRKVSPMQVAAQLLEEALGRVGVKMAPHLEESTGDRKTGEQAPPKPIKSRPPRGAQPRDEGRRAGHRRKKA